MTTISQSDMHIVEANRYYWMLFNQCRNCFYGPCMCDGVVHREPSDTIAVREVTLTNGQRGHKAFTVCTPMRPDEHMCPTDPLLITAKTVAFVMDIHDHCELPWTVKDDKEWWGEYYTQKWQISITKPSTGWRFVKRIGK